MNSELYNKKYKIPEKILNHIKKVLILNPNGIGIKRAKFLLNNKEITYQTLKRLKNFFDYFVSNGKNDIQYELAGGVLMKNFVESTLNSDRNAVKMSKNIKQDVMTKPNSELKPYKTPRLNEEWNYCEFELKKNAVAIILNEDNKILLLKRSDNPNIWMPTKWGLVGGGVEIGETPEEAVKREVFEETKLILDNIKWLFSIKRHKNSIEHIYISKYMGDPTNVVLNEEYNGYGWYHISEISFLDIVPHLLEYLTIAFKKYE